MELSLVLPCFNEEANIRGTTQKSLAWIAREGLDAEIILVDDGSSDRTGTIADELAAGSPRVVALHHEDNRGYGSAIRTGVDAARGDRIVWMDSDGQFDPSDAGQVAALLAGVPFAAAVRRKRADPWRRVLYARLYGAFIGLVLGMKIDDLNCGMRALRREIWPRVRPECGTGALINAEVFLRLRKNGIPWKQIQIPHYPRTAGTQTGGSLGVVFRMLRDLWRLKRKIQSENAE